MRFELNANLPIPVSVAERNGELVLLLRDGAVVDAALVQALNDLARTGLSDDELDAMVNGAE